MLWVSLYYKTFKDTVEHTMSNRNPPCIIYIAFFSSYSPEYSPLQLSQPYSPPNVSKALFLHIILFLPVDQEHQQRTTWNTGSVDRAALDQISNRFVADLVTPLDQLTPISTSTYIENKVEANREGGATKYQFLFYI